MQSLWGATASAAPSLPELNGPVRAEVVIIGGGYTGLSAALHLCESGSDVVALDAAPLGECGSGLNGGQVIAGVKHDPDQLLAGDIAAHRAYVAVQEEWMATPLPDGRVIGILDLRPALRRAREET